MAYGIASNSGSGFVASVVSAESYDPVYDTPIDLEPLFGLLPSWYRTYMEDKNIVLTIWSAFLQAMAAELLQLWQTDYAKSLRDVPVISQRKWIRFDLVEEVDFSTDPGLALLGQEGSFSYSSALDAVTGKWVSRAGLDRAYVSLRGEADQDTSLYWSFVFRVSTAEAKSAALVGYFHSGETQLANALYAAVVGDSVSSGQPRLALLHHSSTGDQTVAQSAYILGLDTDYRIECAYTARDGSFVGKLVEVLALKVGSATGSTSGSSTGAVYTETFSDEFFNFDTGGVVAGDSLLFNGLTYAIVSVDGSSLIVTPATLPADAFDLSYEIRGEIEQASVSLDLPGDASDPTFVVDQFGTSSTDIRTLSSVLISPPGAANRKTLVGRTWAWAYTDPTVAETILALPRLQDTITNPQTTLVEGTDYTIAVGSNGGSTIKLQEPLPTVAWAEYVGYDERYIQNNFGSLVELEAVSSDAYKAQVRGLFYAYYQGPTLSAIRIGVHILIGLPIAEEAGVVEAVDTGFSGTLGQIRVSGTDYLYPLVVGTDLVVGQEVSLFEPLSNGVEIVDYLTDPHWWVHLPAFNEIEKYHSYAIFLDIDAFDLSALQFAAAFVRKVDPTWKSPYFFVFKRLEDEVEIDDDLTFGLALNLWDPPGDGIEVLYDSHDFGDIGVPDWIYDQGTVQWGETSGSMRATATLLAGTAALTNGSATFTGTGTSWLGAIGGPGAVAGKHVALAKYTTGTEGATTAGSNLLLDASSGAFADVQPGDGIEVTGEGVFEVQSKDSNNQLTLDGPMSTSAVSVDWAVTGQLLTWATLASVASNTSLAATTVFPGATGTYFVALLDNDYLNVFYDQFAEAVPDEEVVFQAQLSVGYGETLLTGRLTFTSGSTTVTGVGTNFLGQIGGPGAVTDKYVSLPDGSWVQVASVTDATTLVLSVSAHGSFSSVSSFLADQVLTGTLSFTNGSPTVTASVSQTGIVVANDYLQLVPVQNTADPFGSTPVVQVLSINGPGTTITLTANYSGLTAPAKKGIRRGPGSLLPKAQDLPATRTTVTGLSFTAFRNAAGATISSTLAEPM